MRDNSLICHLNLARGYRGGERQTELLIRALAERGCRQRLVAREGDALITAVADVTNLERVGIRKPFLAHARSCADADLLQVHEAKAGHLACVAYSLFATPYVIARRVDKPPRNSLLNRRLYRNAAAVVAVSAAIADILQGVFPAVNATVIPDAHSDLPVDPAQLAAIKARFPGKFLIGHAGALVNRHKGQLYLIEAMRQLQTDYPKLQLLLMGAGEDEGMLRDAAQGLDNVSFEGFSDHLGDYLAALDLFVFPSLYEGLGSVLLDAMQAGLPIIASDVGGIPEIVEHERNGLLVPPADVDLLRQSIERVYNEAELRQRLSAAASACAAAYAPEAMADQYLNLYSKLELGHAG